MKYTKKYIESKLPELREIILYTKKPAYPSKISDQILVNDLYVLLNSKGLTDEFKFVQDSDFGEHTVNHLISEKYTKEVVEKYKYEIISFLKKRVEIS